MREKRATANAAADHMEILDAGAQQRREGGLERRLSNVLQVFFMQLPFIHFYTRTNIGIYLNICICIGIVLMDNKNPDNERKK